MIIHASMRTDIPAFYSRWMARRIEESFVLVRNPYNPLSVTRYRLSPDVVDLIAFCTKNPVPMLPYMARLSPFRQHWSITVNGYGKALEPGVPPLSSVISGFRRISAIVGPLHTAWRYDPICLTDTFDISFHIAAFSRIASQLEGFTHTCMASFLDLYPKVRENFPEGRLTAPQERITLGKELVRIAKSHGIQFIACAEGTDLAPYGADCRGCFTKERLEALIGAPLRIPKEPRARKECACIMGHDIGAYSSCPHFCRYCYANASPAAVRRNTLRHDPASPYLLGGPSPHDEIHKARQASWILPQMSLF